MWSPAEERRASASSQAQRHPYASEVYAEALEGLGRPVPIPEWESFVLARPIRGGLEDGVGPYPRTPIAAEADLLAGLERLRAAGLVSLVLVPDPLASPDPARMAKTFQLCRPFKSHVLIDRAAGPYAPTKHHADRIRRGRRRCRVELVALASKMEGWGELYGGLIERHAITGPAAFSDPYFPVLAQMSQITCLAAFVGDSLAAMTLWFEHAGVAVSHLTAANALGYAHGANYALNDAAIEHFAEAQVIDLGGAAGAADDPADGLFQFKRGFGNAQIQAFLCGAVLDPARYDDLTTGRGPTSFFPAYRG
jgi:hypothetical protein